MKCKEVHRKTNCEKKDKQHTNNTNNQIYSPNLILSFILIVDVTGKTFLLDNICLLFDLRRELSIHPFDLF